MQKQYKALFLAIFSIHTALIIILAIMNVAGRAPDLLEQIVLWTAPFVALFHSFIFLKPRPATIFFLLTVLLGMLSEISGLKFGFVFGGAYAYDCRQQACIASVPLIIPLFWFVFIYTGYCMALSFLVIEKHKILFPAAAAFFTVSIDLPLDPIMVALGKWHWLQGGPYLDIPIGNFLGWFLVAYLSTAIFILIDKPYLKPVSDKHKKFGYIPVAGYYILMIFMASMAFRLEYPMLFIVIGFVLMIPVALKYFWTRWKFFNFA